MPPDYIDSAIQELVDIYPGRDLTGVEVVLRLLRVSTVIRNQAARTLTATSLRNWGDYETLLLLRRRPTAMTPTALREALLITSAGMTSRLDRLEGAEFVQRVSSSQDRRVVEVRLTRLGAAIIDEVSAKVHENYAAATTDLDGETRECLTLALRSIASNLASVQVERK